MTGKLSDKACREFIHFLAEAVRADLKDILMSSNFMAGEMHASEA